MCAGSLFSLLKKEKRYLPTRSIVGIKDTLLNSEFVNGHYICFYAQPNSLAMLAVKNVTKNAVPKVITTLRVAHFNDLVSL